VLCTCGIVDDVRRDDLIYVQSVHSLARHIGLGRNLPVPRRIARDV